MPQYYLSPRAYRFVNLVPGSLYFIERLISLSSTSSLSRSRHLLGQGMIPQHMIATERNQLDYIHWGDSNELVDRL